MQIAMTHFSKNFARAPKQPPPKNYGILVVGCRMVTPARAHPHPTPTGGRRGSDARHGPSGYGPRVQRKLASTLTTPAPTTRRAECSWWAGPKPSNPPDRVPCDVWAGWPSSAEVNQQSDLLTAKSATAHQTGPQGRTRALWMDDSRIAVLQ